MNPLPSSPVGQPLQGSLVAGGSGAMFDNIAARYDMMNRIMTFGIDQRWRRRTVALLRAPHGARLLDLASGTADMALVAAHGVPGSQILGIDPSAGMLAIGRDKVAAAGLEARVELRLGDACNLPVADRSIDGITMGFGIRNVPDRPQALREMARVLKPGGRACILETSEPRGLLGWGAKLHLRVVVPLLGRLLSGAPAEYRYLQQSTAAFPAPEAFAQLMREAGLDVVEVVPLLAGVAQIYVGTPRS